MFACTWNNIVIRDKELELSGDSGGAKVRRIIKEQNPFDN